jgi:hypothetical protein
VSELEITNFKSLLDDLEKVVKEAELIIDYINKKYPEIMREAVYECLLKEKYGTRK